MQVAPRVHCLWLEFEIETPTGGRVPRFVTSYVLVGDAITIIDTGVATTAPEIFRYIESIGRAPEEIAHVVHTHAHFDHIGGNGLIAARAQPRFLAPEAEREMIEDLDYQHRVRPVGNMRAAVSGPVRVDAFVSGGDALSLGGVAVQVLHTPGHSAGSLSFLVPEEGVLICGDALPEPGTLPIYEGVASTLRSLERLRAVEGAEVLLSAMSRKVSRGAAVSSHIESGARYVREIDGLVREAASRCGGDVVPEEAAEFVFDRLRLPRTGMIPIVVRTFRAHLEEGPVDERIFPSP